MTHLSRFLESLNERPLLLDAGMGLRLIQNRTLFATDDSSWANVGFPQVVRRFHEEDIAAGSDALLTNTFGGNRPNLDWFNATFQKAYDFKAINRRGVAVAREAAGPIRFVIGSIGPMRIPDARAYQEQGEILEKSGVDALILETHVFEDAEIGVRSIAQITSIPLIVSLYRWPADAVGAARTLIDLGVSVLGANCGKTTDDVVECLERLAGRVEVPLLAKPSAGPDEGPDVFAALVPKLLALGVKMIGGCCGTTAQHIAAMRRSLDSSQS